MADLPPSYAAFSASPAAKESVAPAITATATPMDDGNNTITINGKVFAIPPAVGPLTSLAQFIRSNTEFTGTKISCNEGMCGACTVMISYTNPATGLVENHGVNGCLRPVIACAGMHVLTNDGLVGKDPSTLQYVFNKIQSTLADHNGSQCGYCSNGFVMNMYDFLQNNPNPTALEVEHAFDGNLCRCTGYRPILDAMHTFAVDNTSWARGKKAHDDCDEDDCRKKGCQRRQKVFPDLEDVSQFIASKPAHRGERNTHTPSALLAQPSTARRVAAASTDPYGNTWTEVPDMATLNNAVKANPQALIVNATTTFGVFKSDRSLTNTNYLYIGNIPEMRAITSDDNNIYIGGAVTIDAVIRFFQGLVTKSTTWKTKHLPQAIAHLQRIAGRQVRNAGSLAGNIMACLNHQEPTNFFASDGSIILMGLGASVSVYDAVAGREYAWNMPTFFTQTGGKMQGKIITQIIVPLASSANEVFMSYKIAMRQQGAHATVNAGMKATIDPATNTIIKGGPAPIIAIGGIEVKPVDYGAQLTLQGMDTSSIAAVKTLCTALSGLLKCAPMGGREQFRMMTAVNCLYKFILTLYASVPTNALPADLLTALEPWPTRSVSSGTQLFQPDPNMYPVSKAMIKVEAPYQTSGLAKYTNDLPIPERTLKARIVTSTVANCTLKSIDTSVAELLPYFVRFISAANMVSEEANTWANGYVITPIGGKIEFVGQVIGVVLCSDDVSAWLAANSVIATYENVSGPVTTIAQAITNNSYSDNVPPPVQRGDAAQAFKSAAHQITGSVQIGPQIHMFMENHNTTCIPRDDEYEVQSATQMPVLVQMACAAAAGVPTSKVTVSTKLVGGGFGGKLSNSVQVAALATACAAVTGVAVQLLIPLEQTTSTYGFRDVKRMDYQAGVGADGTISSLSVMAYNAAGAANTDEFGDAIVFLHSVDNCYNIANVDFQAKILLLNYAPVAACRGPGWVHAVHAMEAIISDIASQTGMDATALREANFYKQGDSLPDGMLLQYWTLPAVWAQLKQSADFAGKTAAIATFNSANRWRKRGLAMVPCRFGVSLAGANFDSLIAIYPDGTVTVTHGGNEIGQGINTRVAQVVAYKFGISADNINTVAVKPTCTNVVSAGSNVTGGSVTSEMCAASVIHAADTLLRRLAPFKKPNQTWAELIGVASGASVPLTATGWSNAPVSASMFNYNVCAASLTVAEVDILSGQTEIISSDLVYDCGLSTSPLLDIGQIEGGFVFGIGMLMTEENGWNPTTGEINNATHWEYKIPCSFTIPQEFNIALLKNAPNPLGVLGGKATGEPGVCMAASVPQAVESAITAARASLGLGSQRWVCKTYPLTIDKSQQACGMSINNYTL